MFEATCWKLHERRSTINSLGLMGLVPTRTWTIALDPTFGKFCLIRTNFILGELVSLVKVFRLFRFKWIVLVFRVGRCTTSSLYWQGPRVCNALFLCCCSQGLLFWARHVYITWLSNHLPRISSVYLDRTWVSGEIHFPCFFKHSFLVTQLNTISVEQLMSHNLSA